MQTQLSPPLNHEFGVFDLNEKTDLKLNNYTLISSRFLKYTHFAKHVRLRILHRLNPTSRFYNDIFDLTIRYEILIFFQS